MTDSIYETTLNKKKRKHSLNAFLCETELNTDKQPRTKAFELKKKRIKILENETVFLFFCYIFRDTYANE